MEYKKLNIDGYNLHLIKTNRFKTCHIEVVFRNNINEHDITKRQFLTKLLCECNQEYQTKRSLLLRQEDLYAASLYGVTSKVGKMVVSNFCIEFLDPKYTEKSVLKDAIKLLFDIIFKPYVNNNEFNIKSFNIVYNRLKEGIERIGENPKRLSIINALKNYTNTLTGKISLGNIDDLNEITPENLYSYYKDMLKNDYVDIFVIGNLDIESVTNYIVSNANFKVIKNHLVDVYVDNSKTKFKVVKESMVAAQSQVVVVLKLTNLTDYERKYVAHLYSEILGGNSLKSKLYENLRNKNSLCYGVSSHYYKYDELILISTSVDINMSDKAISLIKNSIKLMSKSIMESELNDAKEYTISGLNSIKDSINLIVDNVLFESLDLIDSLDTRIKTFKDVKIDDLYNFSKKVKIGLVYVLDGKENE